MVEVGQRDHVDPGHLRRLPDERADGAAPHHHGSDEEAGPRGVVIEGAQDIARLGRHARFLAQFPQRRFRGGLTRLAMMKYGIDDIRLLLGGDLRFNRQF